MFNRTFTGLGLCIILVGCGAANVPDNQHAGTSSQTSTPQPVAADTAYPSPNTTAETGSSGYPMSTPIPAEVTAYPGPTVGRAGAASDGAEDVLAVWSRTGGFAGFQDSLTLYADGRLEIDKNGTPKTGQAPTMTMEELRSTFASAEWKGLQSEYGQAIADGFIYTIKVGDKHVRTYDGTDPPEPLASVLSQFSALFNSGQ
jgi:hypothetical protein